MTITYVILTCEKYLNTRCAWVRNTWLKHATDYVFLSSKSSGTDVVGWNTTDDYNSCPAKYIELLRNKDIDSDWIVFVDDDTFVFPERLSHLLSSLDASIPYYVGYTLDHEPSGLFMSGGAGFAITKVLYKELQEHVRSHTNEELIVHVGSDVCIARWMKSPILYDVRAMNPNLNHVNEYTCYTVHPCSEELFTRYSKLLGPPVFIISYNNPTYVMSMVEQVKRYTSNYYVVDNASTFSPHVAYLKTVEPRVIYMDKNYGHSVYYEPRIWNMSGDKFIITDPDLTLNPNMPKNVIGILSEISDTYGVNKVGLALDITGPIRQDFRLKSGETIVEWESQFWKNRIPHDKYELYDAALDTTFCLFNKRIPGYSAIRIAGDFTCKHRPWYSGWESELLPNELDAYRNKNVSSHYTMNPEYSEPAGRQHYRLLEILSTKFSNCTLFDIGTHKGMSALALSKNPTNTVVSFDIVEKSGLPEKSNIQYHTDDLMTPEGRELWKDTLLAAPFIFLDIDPHEGTREYVFYEWLRDNDYRGFLVCDDIWHFKEMRDNFWTKIPAHHKVDITHRGHWSGTGIVRFHPSEMWPLEPTGTNWTVVTAYFDLTKMEDASDSIRGRPVSHYLQHAKSTMELNQNLVVFCEPENLETIRAMRPAHLLDHTKFIAMSFEDFPLSKYRGKILENRKVRPSPDNRNTASYYLLCMARYAMLKQVIAENPFGSTHFAWLNICIERMGPRNVHELPRVFEINRDKFSTCYIDYQPKENYLDIVMRWGRCSMCSGFFTGNAHYMKTFCDRIEQKFLECLEKGYGHADEQLFSLVYFDDPDIFEVYYGDYTEMVTNYEWIRDRPRQPLYLLIKHSYDNGDYATCLPGCIALWRSWKKGHARLGEEEVSHLIWYYEHALQALGLPRELE